MTKRYFTPDNDLLTTSEAARYIGRSKPTLDRYRHEGHGPAYFKLGGAVRYNRRDLDAWIAAGRVQHGETSAAQTVAPQASAPLHYNVSIKPLDGEPTTADEALLRWSEAVLERKRAEEAERAARAVWMRFEREAAAKQGA